MAAKAKAASKPAAKATPKSTKAKAAKKPAAKKSTKARAGAK